jgi:hypothetical protein
MDTDIPFEVPVPERQYLPVSYPICVWANLRKITFKKHFHVFSCCLCALFCSLSTLGRQTRRSKRMGACCIYGSKGWTTKIECCSWVEVVRFK